jgi:hypothetical protein
MDFIDFALATCFINDYKLGVARVVYWKFSNFS